jgi:hypothetical protein
MQKAGVSNIWVRFRKWKTRRIRQSPLFCGDIDLGPPRQAPNNMTVASARNLVPTGSPQFAVAVCTDLNTGVVVMKSAQDGK